MGNEENMSSEEEGYEVLEENEADEDTKEGMTEGGTNEISDEFKRNVESVCSQNEDDWKEISSNSDDSMIILFQ